MFGVLIIILVYIPILMLSGIEGKMFQPMAFTVIAALVGALLFSVTFIPAAIALFVKGQMNEKENWLMSNARRLYLPLLSFSIKRPVVLVSFATIMVVISSYQATKLGSEFLPQLDEHDIALHALRIPGTGLEQAVGMQIQLGNVIKELDEVERVFAKIGTPEIATDPMPPSVADTIIILKPRELWSNPSKTKQQFLNELRELVEAVPGNKYEFTQPIEMRFNELIAGVRSDVAVRIYGDDLDVLAEYGERASQLLAQVNGAKDVRVEQMKGLPMLSIEPQRDHMALLGLTVSDLQQTVQAAVGGIQTGIIYEGDRRFKLMVRMDKSVRKDPAAIARIPIALSRDKSPELSYVPLGEVATVSEIEGPNQVNRQNGKRNIVATANVEGQDLGSFIKATQQIMNEQLKLPSGYWLEYGGTFEQLESASKRLSIVVPITLFLIFGLLYSAFGSLRDSVIIFTGIPLALTGGVLALTLRGMPLSISAAVGFIALSGVSVLNGVVMLSFIQSIRKKGTELVESIQMGASQRLRPILMTALVASLGFVPMAFNIGAGAEVQRPLATVVIGGIISSTLLSLLVLPALTKLVYGVSEKFTKSR